jgi:hypothetical protein
VRRLEKRDIDVQNRDGGEKERPSLRNLGKAVGALGALDTTQVVRSSTGGVWTAKQLAEVAKAVKFANYNVDVITRSDPGAFISALCSAIDKGVPPIVAFDVNEGDPVPDAAGQWSHWGVVIGYFLEKGVTWFVATHGHGGYYSWQARSLQEANFALVGTKYHQSAEEKVRLSGEGIPDLPLVNKYKRSQWLDPGDESAKKLKLLVAKKGWRLEMHEQREPFDVSQDLGRHIVLVEPA